MSKIEEKRAFCEMCHSRCRVLVHSKNGEVVKVEGDKTYPLVNDVAPPTSACRRLQGIRYWTHHPDRLNFPLKRAGERGEGKWQTLSWDQAFDEMAERLARLKEKYGEETLVYTGGTGRTRDHFTARFMNQFGSPNLIGHSQVCLSICVNLSAATFGWPLRHRTSLRVEKDAKGQPKTKCVLLTGIVADQSTLRLWKTVRDAKNLGTKLIVIDPRRTAAAEIADIWLQIRPTTNAALLLAMLNVIIEEKLYDKEFVEKWCYGFDDLVKRVKEYPPEEMAKVTWVPAKKIKEAARMFATNKPAMGAHGMGHEHHRDTASADRARFILMAITGNIDIEGGEYIPGPPRCIPEAALEGREYITEKQRQKQIGLDRFRVVSHPFYNELQKNSARVWGKDKPWGLGRTNYAAHAPSVYRAMVTGNPYPVRGAISLAANPMVTAANTKLVYQALKSLDLYIVSEFWVTPSAQLADYVLPASNWIERPYFATFMGLDCQMTAGEQALPNIVPGKYERLHDFDFYRGLGVRLGQNWPWKTLEETFDYQLSTTGMTFRQFMDKGGFEFPPPEYKKYEKRGFSTISGKVELRSNMLEKYGYDPLPEWTERHPIVTKPELAKEFPLHLITGGRFLPMYHSEQRQIDSVRKIHPHPLVQINPKTAKKHGIEDGDWVWIESPMGRIRQKCQYFDGIDPKVVHCEHGWWFPELPGEFPWLHGVFESNANVLIDDDPDNCDPIGGAWPLKGMLCKIYKAKVY